MTRNLNSKVDDVNGKQFSVYFLLYFLLFLQNTPEQQEKCWNIVKNTHLSFHVFFNFTFTSFYSGIFFDSFENWKKKKNYQEKEIDEKNLIFFFVFFLFPVLYTLFVHRAFAVFDVLKSYFQNTKMYK